MKKLTRVEALREIRFAGYHKDQSRFVTLYTDHRIAYPVAIQAYREGMDLRAKGYGCNCFACQQKQASLPRAVSLLDH